MSASWRYLNELCRHPHRGSATKGEEAASRDIALWLRALGYSPAVQEFCAPRDTLYLGPGLVLSGAAICAGIGTVYPLWALMLCLLLLLPLVGEMLGSSRFDLDWMLPRYPSRNVVARLPAQRECKRTVVLSAHYDTQRASLLFHPRFLPWLQPYFYLVYGSLILVPVALMVRAALPGWAWGNGLLVLCAGVATTHALFLLLCRLTGRYINGANDNGTGVALVLAMAERFATQPPLHTEVIFLFTGSEEVGTRGMKHFMKSARLDRKSASFVNLDNLGGGMLHVLTGEGMLLFCPYGGDLLALSERVGHECGCPVRQRKSLPLPTDGLIPARKGYQSVSFVTLSADGMLPNYHWYTDTTQRVDQELLAQVERFTAHYLERLCGESEPMKPNPLEWRS